MNSSKWIWRFVSIVSIITTLILLAGFIYAFNDINDPQAGLEIKPQTPQLEEVEKPWNNKTEFKVSAIGDSLAKGTGDQTGSGFAKRMVEALSENSGKKTTLLNNLGINGLTTEGLVNKLDEVGVQYVLQQSDIILLSIGGNDLFQGAQLLTSDNTNSVGSNGIGSTEITPEKMLDVIPKASEQLKVSLEKLTEINPNAYIIYMGLYNPFGDIQELKIPGNEAVSIWNSTALTIINGYENMTLVPTYDLFTHNLARYLSTDHFHPNAEGYQQIANRMIQGIQ